MMRSKSATKHLGLTVVIFALIFALAFALIACGNSETGGADYRITLEKTAITLDKGQSAELKYSITKNGEADETAEIEVSVSNDNVTYDAATNKITAVKTGTAAVTVKVKGTQAKAVCNVTIPEYTVELAGDAEQKVNLGDEQNIEFTVRKDGLKVSDKKVKIEVTDGKEFVTYIAVGNRIKFEKEGTATVKATLADDPSVFAVKKYIIEKSFWSSEYQVNKDVMTITDDSVYFPGGANQYYLGVMEGGTKYMFKADLKLPKIGVENQSIGLGHTTSKNDNSMWFGFQKASGENGYRVYLRNFYDGWGGAPEWKPENYNNIVFDGDIVTCYTIRDGNDYWYNLGGLIGKYSTDKVDESTPTWAGVYSQENILTITNFSFTTDDEAIAAAKAECEKDCAIFKFINPAEQAVKGTAVTVKAKKVCPEGKNPEIQWSLDKAEMTAGQDGTSISGGVLTLAPDAAGFVTVKATCGGIEDSVRIEILQESLADENETVIVDGGVVLDKENGNITFTESGNGANPALNANEYVDIYYAAKLKTRVKGDFELTFKVTDLKTTGGSRYMVSLGEKLGNLMFTENGVTLVTKKVDRVNADQKALTEGEVTATFEKADEYVITIAVVGGHYEVTVNETKLTFSSDPIRRIEDYTAERNILITTEAGTSMTVSELALDDKADAKYILLNDNSTVVTEGEGGAIKGFTSVMLPNEWVSKDNFITSVYYGELLPEGNYTVTYNVKFNKAMKDGKFAINIGNYDFQIVNKGDTAIAGLIQIDGWDTTSVDTKTADEVLRCEIKKIDNDLYFYINGKLMGKKTITDASKYSRIMRSYTFDARNDATPDSNVQVTDLTVTEGAIIMTMNGPESVQVGTTSPAYSVQVIGSNEEPVWTMSAEGTLTAGEATFDQTNKTVTFSNDAEGYVTIAAAIGEVKVSIRVTASSQPADQNTALAESKGGVKQDVTNGKIIFDDATKNGVADEHAYSENSTYYAILNTATNARAVIHDNFELEFTVSDYVTTAQYPKLMISLGYKFEQFYIAYTNDGARIEAYTMQPTSGNSNAGYWVNSDYFTLDDEKAEHTYKLVCEDGYYSWSVDGTPITFGSTRIFRSVDAIAIPCNIMMSTNAGTTAVVSDISLSPIAGKEGVTKTYSQNFTTNADGSITAKFASVSRDGRAGYHNADSVYTYGAISDNCEIVLSVTFNNGNDYPDEALLIRFGSNRSFGVIMNNGTAKIEQQYTFTAYSLNTENRLYNNTVKIKITVENGYVTAVRAMEHNADGTEKGWSESKVAMNDANLNDQKVNGFLSFGMFVYNEPSGNTVTISGITVTPTTGA